MAVELRLEFTAEDRVSVRLLGAGNKPPTPPAPFTPPLDEQARKDLHWYLEVFPTAYTADHEDETAAAVAGKLEGWGTDLFNAVFNGKARDLLTSFCESREDGKLLTIASDHPVVLAQLWELLYHPDDSTYLFLKQPRISIRRTLTGGADPCAVAPKPRLHLLFVVSRPQEDGFIDPRADALAVMDAIDAEAPGRVTIEVLRPPTLAALLARLEDRRKPAVDILHFDGHGAYGVATGGTATGATAHGTLMRAAPDTAPMGYLLFETADGKRHAVSADELGEYLQGKQVGLMVLSACRSAMVGGKDPLGCVAARLVHAGLPSVLAMTQSVLVATTKALFGAFYRYLGRGDGIGAALDTARRDIRLNKQRGERQRGADKVPLELHDWFLPALYQSGPGEALLDADAPEPEPAAPWGNLPDLPESGFYGRGRELWQIDRLLSGQTRRLVLHGFGGQGKTFLAQEAGRWLYRTGLVRRVGFVGYAAYQGSDPVALAVSTLAMALGENLIDAAAVTRTLATTPTLVILDNLESLSGPALREVLDAAVPWSRAGGSRVLITTRAPDLGHADYPTDGSNQTRFLPLHGLAPDDALHWVEHLMSLGEPPRWPRPERRALQALFARVDHHPLSLSLLAAQLKLRRPADLGERLEGLLQAGNDALLASLTLSLDRLAPELRALLPRLGVFQGGAMDFMIPEVTGITPEAWARLRRDLERTALLAAEAVPEGEVPYLRFHPTLAPALWQRLDAAERAELTAAHSRHYYEAVSELHGMDQTAAVHAARAIARRELPNLLAAVTAALDVEAATAVDFVDRVCRFLGVFGLDRDRAGLQSRAQAVAGAKGSPTWYIARSNQGEMLLAQGQVAEAAAVFREVLDHLPPQPGVQRGATLARLARCLRAQQQIAEAETALRQALAEVTVLPQSDDVRNLTASLHADLGDTVMARGAYAEAEQEHQESLTLSQGLADARGVAVSEAQLGKLALLRRDLPEAQRRYEAAIATFQALGEPEVEATATYYLGMTLQQAKRWSEAEAAYRRAAYLRESLGRLLAAADAWGQLALLMKTSGRPAKAEPWYRKALQASRDGGDVARVAITLNNLASLLFTLDRLAEARAAAEEALALSLTMDPAAAEIWKTYGILADIAGRDGRAEVAAEYRRQARQSFAAAPVAQETLRRAAPLIDAVRAAIADPAARPQTEAFLDDLAQHGRADLSDTLRQVLAGARDADALCEPLAYQDSYIVAALLRALAETSPPP